MCGGGKFVIGGKWSVGWEGLWWHRKMISWIISVGHSCLFARMILIIKRNGGRAFRRNDYEALCEGVGRSVVDRCDVSVLLRVTAGGHNVT